MHRVTVRLQGGGDKCVTEAKTTIRLPKEWTTIGTWNVCSLHACQKVQELTKELKGCRWDILGLEKLPRMRGTRSSTGRRLKMPVWGGLHCTEKGCR